jgi:hypothetical protein
VLRRRQVCTWLNYAGKKPDRHCVTGPSVPLHMSNYSGMPTKQVHAYPPARDAQRLAVS